MFERFSDRARATMQLANQEAQRFNHEYIGTEHILLGLIKEGAGIGANALKNLGIDLWKARLEVEKIVQPGPETMNFGKLPHSPRANKVIEGALEEARDMHHNYVGTEHLLLGLLREKEGIAAQVLESLGATLEKVRAETLVLIGGYYKPEVKKVCEGDAGTATVNLNPFTAWWQVQVSQPRDWLTEMQEYFITKDNFDKVAEIRDVIDKIRKLGVEWDRVQKQDELNECRQRVAELEKELGDANDIDNQRPAPGGEEQPDRPA